MLLAHFYNQNHGKVALVSDFWLYEFSVWLHVVARSLVSVFVPILMYQLGFSLGAIMVYYLVYNFFDVPLNFVARELVVRIGARAVVTIGTLFAMLFFYLFTLLTVGGWYILLLMALVAALYDSLYWVGHVYLFINSSGDDEDVGKKTGTFYIIRKLGSIAAPLVGGAILIFGDTSTLLYGSIVVFVFSLVPLMWVDEFEDKPSKPLVQPKEFFKDPQEKKDYLTTILFGVHSSAESVLWPLFIFTVFGTIESVALIPLIVGVATVGLSYFAGHIKKASRDNAVMWGALAIAFVWLLRMYVPETFVYHLSVFLVGVFALLVTIPLDSNIFTRGKRIDALQASTYRNTCSMGAKVVLYGVLAVLLNVFNVSFMVAMICLFGVVGVSYLFIHNKTVE